MQSSVATSTALLPAAVLPISTPVPARIPGSHKIRAVDMGQPFHLMALPDELRLKIYRSVLPVGERLIIDPDEMFFPSCYAEKAAEDYGEMYPLLLTCKKINAEVMEFVYTHNMVTVINPIAAREYPGDFFNDIGASTWQFITKLEVNINTDIGELGTAWLEMASCPKLADLRLVFYHDKVNWSRTLAQLTNKVVTMQDEAQKTGGKNIMVPEIMVELHTSIWVHHSIDVEAYTMLLDQHYICAEAHTQFYSYTLPHALRRITITASVAPTAAEALLSYKQSFGKKDWGFMDQTGDGKDEKKLLRWARIESRKSCS